MSITLLAAFGEEIEKLVDPLAGAIDSPHAFDLLLAELGATTPSLVSDSERDALLAALTAILDLKAQIDAFAQEDSPSLRSIAALLALLRQAFEAVRALNGLVGAAGAFANLGEDLVNYLVSSYLRRFYPLAHSLAALVTLIEPAEESELRLPVVQGEEMLRDFVSLDRFHLRRLMDLVRDPLATLRAEYGSALTTAEDTNQIARKLFPRLVRVLRALHVPCRYGFAPDETELMGDAAPLVEHALIVYADDMLAGAPAEAGVVLNLSPADRGDLGLVISPFGTLTTTKHVQGWTIALSCTAGLDLLAYGRHGLTLLADASTAEVQGRISATLPAPGQRPAFVLGAADGSRLEVGGAHITAETALSEAQQSLALSAAVSSAALVIAPGDGDGFLDSVLPAEGLQAKFDLGVEWSNDRGLTFRGAGSLDATLPVALSIRDMLTVPTIHLSLQARDAALVAEVSATIGVSIGPVHAVIERVGLAAAVTFPDTGGNLGIGDLALDFKPPNGVGLSIDAVGVTGGGFLRFDAGQGQYAGIVQLELEGGITVTGQGLIATRLPDGSKGFSLLVIITAADFKPVPLGLGFSLTGIGGLLAVNRTFDEHVLRAGLKNHTLDSVLFPTDPIRNAPQILSNLHKVFPPANGHYLFGPIVRLAWGTPPLITADLGLVLEFGARLRLLILGQIAAILPRRDNDLIRLQMDTIGVIDFEQGTAALDATLYDSRLLKKFVLTGDMAMRLRWEGSPTFALAIGGLHPAFNPPPNFPKLERIALNLAAGDNPRLRCEAYFALTANTVQFGAHAELYAEAAGFSIQGETGFDVLLQLDPFQFLADFYAQVQLKRGSRNLFKVRVEGALAGPRPLRLTGKATFEVLWMDVTFRIDKTLVAGDKPPRPAPVDILPRLQEALEHPDNWVGRLPDGQRPMVTLRPRPEAANEVALHPLGTLTVKQNVVPLNLEITRFGQTTPAGERRFTLSSDRPTQPVRDFFAPAQFFELSDDEKLSWPSFQALEAGVSLSPEALTFSDNPDNWLAVDAIRFDTITIDPQTNVSQASSPAEAYALSLKLLEQQAHFGAAGASALRHLGTARYRTARVGPQLVKEGWSLVDTTDLSVLAVPGREAGTPMAYAEAVEALRHLHQEDPVRARGVKILRLSELQGATAGPA